MHGFDYSGFFEGSDPVRAQIIKSGVNFMLAPDRADSMKDFMKESQLLHNALTLCRSLITQQEKQEVAFMDAVRVLLSRLAQKGPLTKKDINERISRLLEQSIQSQGVISIIDVKGGKKHDFSLFDEAFQKEIRKMKEKNLAVKLLERLLKERIHQYQRTNVVQSKKFSDLLNMALSNYLKGMLTNEEVIEELLKMAEEIKQNEEESNKLGLSVEEKAFYDALSSPEGIREAYTDEQFVALTRELTEQLRKNRTIDWNRKESARAKMRVLVKRLLKKYKYPPEGQEKALETVMEQCNKWADDDENVNERKLANVEDDRDVRNLIFNCIHMDADISDAALQREVIELYGDQYPDMTVNDWRHIIEAYTPMVREASRPKAKEVSMDPERLPMAAEDMSSDE